MVDCAGLENRKHALSTGDSREACDHPENRLSPDLSLSVANHPELANLIRAWPDLPEALRAGIAVMVKSAKLTQG